MKLYGAIDLHSNNSVVTVIDEQDRVVYERRLPRLDRRPNTAREVRRKIVKGLLA